MWQSYDNHRIHQNRNREGKLSVVAVATYLPRPFAETETKKTNVSNMVVQTQQKKNQDKRTKTTQVRDQTRMQIDID